MTAIDPTRLSEFLRAQRWFAGKATPIKNVSLVQALDLGKAVGKELFIAVVQVTYELGLPEHYLVPFRLGPGGELVDAAESEALMSYLFELVREGERVESGAGALRGETVGQAQEALRQIPRPPQLRHVGVEQSNSSMVLNERVIFKVIRKLEPGINPELEVGRFLATQTRFRATPTLLGALQLEGPVAATVGLLHDFVPNRGDGWRFITEVFRAGSVPSKAVLGEIESLGKSVGQMHLALGTPTSDPAFQAEPILLEDLQRWSSSIIGELGVTLAAATQAFPILMDRRPALLDRAQRLAHIEPCGKKIRQHGDLHLGQILRGDQGWLLIDFEGEPARNFEQRREKHSPLRDVAGMLRSFAYAAGSAKLSGEAKVASLRLSREAFLRGYRTTVDGSGLLPPSEETLSVLLDALELEKTLYEVRYELQMRPDWVHIPVESLLA